MTYDSRKCTNRVQEGVFVYLSLGLGSSKLTIPPKACCLFSGDCPLNCNLSCVVQLGCRKPASWKRSASFVLLVHWVLSILGVLSFGGESLAQSHYNFENISTDQGLSNGWVLSILQDSKGFIWFGTGNALDRYDGYKFKSFGTHGPTAMLEDKSGKLDLVSDLGLEIFDPTTESYTSFLKQIDSLKISRRMRFEAADKDGNLWITSQEYRDCKGALIFFNARQRTFRRFDNDDLNYGSAVMIDEFGNVWVGGNGISIFDPKQERFIFHFAPERKGLVSVAGDYVSSFYKERDGVIWASTSNGVSRISYSRDYRLAFENLRNDPGNSNSLVSNNTSCIMKDNRGYLWIATIDGVSRYDPRLHEFMNFVGSSAPGALKETHTAVVFQDKGGTIWIGHFTIGSSRIKPNKGFIQLTAGASPGQSLATNNTAGVYMDRRGTIWLGVVDQGIHQIDYQGNYNSTPNISVSSQKYRRIASLIKDENDEMWVGGQENVLHRLSDARTLGDQFGFVVSMVADHNKNLWALDESGLYKIGNRKGPSPELVHILPDPALKSKFEKLNFSDMFEDDKKRLWVTNWEGEIYCFDTLSGRFFMPPVKSDSAFHQSEAQISTMISTRDDHLWAGTLQGLCKYKIENDRNNGMTLVFEKMYGQKDGLEKNGKPNLYTATLEEDLHGNIWLAQNSGLYKLNPADNTLTHFGTEDGLAGNTFAIRASCPLKDGYLAFGSTTGLVIFHPDSLKDNTSLPSIVFTDLQLLNRSVAPNRSFEQSDFTLAQTAPYTTEVEVPYNLNVVGFEFASLDYTAPEKNQYAYQMVGFDPDWVYSGTRRLATYTNLDPGHYTFRVKGTNNDGYWNETGASMAVTILPPPWRTWWAYAAYGLAMIGLLILSRNEILKRERLRNQFRLKEVEANKYHELDVLKSRFFSNISHEFRTPLTLILGPLQKRLNQALNPSDKQDFSVMQRNAQRLLNLVNQLLDLSRIEAGMLKLKCRMEDLRDLVGVIASQFASIADSKQITFRVLQDEDILIWVDSDKFNKILSNLLSNAFKFTPEGGIIEVIVRKGMPDAAFTEGWAEIVVSDTGPGIPPEQMQKVFDRFHQVDSSTTREFEGSGIGLALTKELVELHYGDITVSSVISHGSLFTVRLPLGKSHLRADDCVILEADSTVEITTVDFQEREEAWSDQNDGSEAQPRILVVEDNPDLRSYLHSSLNDNYQILEAANGELGISVARAEVPDLIISDLMMPKMNGIELCRRLKTDLKTSHIPIILLTAKADVESKLEGLQVGADDYIAKPFDMRELESRIHNLIAIRRKLQENFSARLTLSPREITVDSVDDRFLKQVMEIVESEMADPSLGVDSLAQQCAMSPIQLYRKLKALTGHGPNDLVRNFRLSRAASLLAQQSGSVADIAYQVGFNSLSYFSKCFKDKYGKTPSEYLRKSE